MMTTPKVINLSDVKVNRRKQALQELIDLTEVILQSAEQGDWSKAVDDQRHRRQLMENFFSESTLPEESETVAAAIQYILDIDAKVTSIVYSQRQELLESASKVQNTNKAAQAYLRHSD